VDIQASQVHLGTPDTRDRVDIPDTPVQERVVIQATPDSVDLRATADSPVLQGIPGTLDRADFQVTVGIQGRVFQDIPAILDLVVPRDILGTVAIQGSQG